MISLSVFASLAILPFVTAQASDPGLEIKAIQAHFSGSGITPSLLPTFDPSAVLSVTFGTTAVTPGQALTKDRGLKFSVVSFIVLTGSAQRSHHPRPFQLLLPTRPSTSVAPTRLQWLMLAQLAPTNLKVSQGIGW